MTYNYIALEKSSKTGQLDNPDVLLCGNPRQGRQGSGFQQTTGFFRNRSLTDEMSRIALKAETAPDQ